MNIVRTSIWIMRFKPNTSCKVKEKQTWQHTLLHSPSPRILSHTH